MLVGIQTRLSSVTYVPKGQQHMSGAVDQMSTGEPAMVPTRAALCMSMYK